MFVKRTSKTGVAICLSKRNVDRTFDILGPSISRLAPDVDIFFSGLRERKFRPDFLESRVESSPPPSNLKN
jgi:hypothetical protein